MSKILENAVNDLGGGKTVLRGIGGLPSTSNKRALPVLRRSFIKVIGVNNHTCIKKNEQKDKQITQSRNKTKKLTKKEKQMKQHQNKINIKQKITTLLTIIILTTSCSTNKHHKKITLKIIQNNNVILKQIKNERSVKKIATYQKNKTELLKAEKRLRAAINAVIKSNNSLKNELNKRATKEVKFEKMERAEYRRR